MRFKQMKPQHVKNDDEKEDSHNHMNRDTYAQCSNAVAVWNVLDFVDGDLGVHTQNCLQTGLEATINGHNMEFDMIKECAESRTLLEVHLNDPAAPLAPDNGVIIHGRRPIFSESEEINIASQMKQWKDQGRKYTRLDVVKMASEYAIHLGKRPHCRPLTVKWFRSFLTRHPECYIRKSRRTKIEQPEKQYFSQLDTVLTANNLKESPHCIFSLVELPMPLLRNGHVTIAEDLSMNKNKRIGAISHHMMTVQEQAPSSILFCGSAAGQALPPFLLFASNMADKSFLPSLTPGAGGITCPTGQITSEVLISFLRDHFLSQAPGRAGDTLVLLIDESLTGNISQAVIDIGSAFKVVFVTAHTSLSPQLHPMVVGCCDTFQRELSYELQKPLYTSESAPLSSSASICELLCRLYHHNMTAENLHTTFKKAGIFPFNPAIYRKQYSAAAISKNLCSGNSSKTLNAVSKDLTLRLRRSNNKHRLAEQNKIAEN